MYNILVSISLKDLHWLFNKDLFYYDENKGTVLYESIVIVGGYP